MEEVLTQQGIETAEEERQRRSGLLIWWLVLPILVLLLFFGVHQAALRSLAAVPITETGSKLRADYGPWLFTRFFPVDETILETIQEEEGINSIIPVAADDDSGAFWTDAGDDDPIAVAQVSPTPTSPPPATATPNPPTNTPKPPPPPTATKKPKKKPTKTPTDTPLPTETFTPGPPTDTFTPGPPTDTFTPAPPTATFTPGGPTNTFTPVPPTADCSSIKISKPKTVAGNKVTWAVTNNSAFPVTMTNVNVTWDASTGIGLKQVKVNGALVFDGTNNSGTYSKGGSWSISVGGNVEVEAEFAPPPAGHGLQVVVNGCNK